MKLTKYKFQWIDYVASGFELETKSNRIRVGWWTCPWKKLPAIFFARNEPGKWNLRIGKAAIAIRTKHLQAK